MTKNVNTKNVMKNVKTIVSIASIVAIILSFSFLYLVLSGRSKELDRVMRNMDALQSDVIRWRTSDSLSAARADALEFKIREFEKYRSEDAALIKSLKGRNEELQSVAKAMTETIFDLMAVPKDTVVIRDSVQVPAVAVRCGDEWFDFEGVLSDGVFAGRLVNRDSILCIETIEYRRFLGFLWKTRNIKSRDIIVTSRNPHTEIIGADFVTIEKD